MGLNLINLIPNRSVTVSRSNQIKQIILGRNMPAKIEREINKNLKSSYNVFDWLIVYRMDGPPTVKQFSFKFPTTHWG